MKKHKIILLSLSIPFLLSHCNSKKDHDVKKIQCGKKVFFADTLHYSSNIEITNNFSIEIKTVLYDTTVIPLESMGIQDNVKNQKIYFKKDQKILKCYEIPSEKHSVWDIYMIDSLESINKMLSINQINDVSVFISSQDEVFYFFEGGENIIDKSEYNLITDQEGNIIYEKYKNRKGSLKDFLAKINMLEAWRNDKFYLNKISFYPLESCGKQNFQIAWID